MNKKIIRSKILKIFAYQLPDGTRILYDKFHNIYFPLCETTDQCIYRYIFTKDKIIKKHYFHIYGNTFTYLI